MCHYKTPRSGEKGDRQETALRVEGKKGTGKKPPDLMECALSNSDLLEAVKNLCFMEDNQVKQRVDYKNLGPEELGSVYESLLELHPRVDYYEKEFTLESTGGSERKTSGSYYTPSGLIVLLLDSALEPVLKERRTEAEVLSLKVCDPACGSGHFLLAAAHVIARRLASIRTGEAEPSPKALRTALRDVIGRCIYGVDINSMSVELCKVGLWMEALEPGKPLSFLEHHIVCGNSLMGAYPAFIQKGIPDEAFEYMEGDDKGVCKKYKAFNKQDRGAAAARRLFDAAGEAWTTDARISAGFQNIDAMDDSSLRNVREKEAAYREITGSDNYMQSKLTADAWCAAFVWKKQETGDIPYPIHEEVFRTLKNNPLSVPGWMKREIQELAKQYGFLHYHLVFPGVFRVPSGNEKPGNPHTGWSGGFDVVLGNPPWERIKLQQKEWFAAHCPDIADAATAAIRGDMIALLSTENPVYHEEYLKALRQSEGESHFIRNSGEFPLCGRGDINTYMIFSELNRALVSRNGYIGCIVPSGIATDDTTKTFFQDLTDTRALVSLYDFENRKALFPGVHRSYKFCLLTVTGRKRPVGEGTTFIFFAQDTGDLKDPGRVFTLSPEDIALVNPNTRTCPIFRFNRDAESVKQVYRSVPVLMDETKNLNPWNLRFLTLFHMTNDSALFRTGEALENEGWKLEGNRFKKDNRWFYPLYEAKMMHQYNHRFGDYRDLPEESKSTQLPDVPVERLQDPRYVVMPRFWVEENAVKEKLERIEYRNNWLMGWRDICRSTDERTMIASIIPLVGVGNKIPLFIFKSSENHAIISLFASLNSFVLDYIARQKVGGTSMNYFYLKQLPVLSPGDYEKAAPWDKNVKLVDWIKSRVLELVYTSWDLQDFAKDMGCEGSPFPWDDERRFQLKCELDAAFFLLYGIRETDVDYIMETFPIVKRKDIALYGSYRTKERILELYREMRRKRGG